MTTVAQYQDALRQSAAAVSRKMGANFSGTDKQTRVIVRVTLGVFATLIKLLVDKGLITDAEIQAALTAAATTGYTDEPLVTPEPVSETTPADTVTAAATIPEITPWQ